MIYCVNVPLEQEIQFPNRCPFSDQLSPSATVQLKRTSTSMLVPFPGGSLNSYSKTAFRMPAAKKVAALAISIQIMMWLSILGSMAAPVLVMALGDGRHERYAALFIPIGLIGALGFRIARWFVLRRVGIAKPWNGFMELRFASEAFAKEFSTLNGLALVTA
jgi:hypothetical protein